MAPNVLYWNKDMLHGVVGDEVEGVVGSKIIHGEDSVKLKIWEAIGGSHNTVGWVFCLSPMSNTEKILM